MRASVLSRIAVSKFAALALVATMVMVVGCVVEVVDDDPPGPTGGSSMVDVRWYTSNQSSLTYNITTAAQLAGLAQLVNEGNSFSNRTVVLRNSISLLSYGPMNNSFNDGRGWIPIGTDGKPFSGIFDGGDHIISGLYINNNTRNFVGLFGDISGGVVKNLGIANGQVTGRANNGGLVGRVTGAGSSITDCWFSGTVTGNAESTGGLAGVLAGGGTISRSLSEAVVSGISLVGGLVGRLADGGTAVNNSYATGNVSGGRAVGGLVGETRGASIVSNCYAINNVVSTASYVGGLVGETWDGSITNSAALNPNIGAVGAYGRARGENSGAIVNTVAFIDMMFDDLPTAWNNEARNGTDITADEIYDDPTIGNRFRESNGWTVVPGYLPGLFGEPVEMPAHLQ